MVTVRFSVWMDSWRLILPVVFSDICAFRLMGFGLFPVSIFVFQAAIRGSSFNRTICS